MKIDFIPLFERCTLLAMRLPSRTSVIAAALLVVATGTVTAQLLPQSRFRDVPQNVFFAEPAEIMANRGIITGYDDGRFGGYDYVTRGQVATILDRYDKLVVQPMRLQVIEMRQQMGLPYCGDGTQQTGEQCDDGNWNGGDGCSAECIAEAVCPGGYTVGESFNATDGCNTCTCTLGGIACTQRACTTPNKKCFSTGECGANEYCSVDTGDCQYPCPPGVQCIQACGGVCLPRVTPSVPVPTCGNGICDSGEVAFLDRTGVGVYCPQDCPAITAVCGNGVCEKGEADQYTIACPPSAPSCAPQLIQRGSCTTDCEGGLSACERLKNHLDTLFTQETTCIQDSDCAVYTRGCSPYQTCGKAIEASAMTEISTQVENYVTQCPDTSTPEFCTLCAQTSAACQNNVCVLIQ